MKQYSRSLSTGLFIQIENKYTYAQNIIFPLSDLRAIYNACNSGETVVLMIDGMSEQSPSISYKIFVQFFTDVINAIEKLNPQAFIFKLTVNEDLSCEWCDFHRTSSN
ncbi:hypothetical protein [Xenorhabdus innexi]|uniref:Uncharacterized protein n=1 Tax=Xenorhabdus innexi TaxID=290109 RepID=A0A1N6MRT7_9GAMM|nr:hypothetical protein [Xenorhabdus innexi]PHM38558.1 hypothetical protein Xinn_00255 [Xenorhabdus innexi]SIP71556.1 conserved hypothetical protein [Xenorhabdus innexi]